MKEKAPFFLLVLIFALSMGFLWRQENHDHRWGKWETVSLYGDMQTETYLRRECGAWGCIASEERRSKP